ncbi:MAG: phenylalanine--tRNA ligase subunit beta [Firmicutes bacterium]|nr:phenylalanine--tRNA ligase subunit beta [Bacillota bacterium]
MLVPLKWLKELVKIPSGVEVDRLREDLTGIGLAVEAVESSPDGEQVLCFEITTNRPDCLSVLGIAREAAALYRTGYRRPAFRLAEGGQPASDLAVAAVTDAALCPRYGARVVEGIRIGPSPDWLCARLEAAGVRPINNVVDATNYVMLELGQPLHAFDFDTLAGRRIIVRPAWEEETLVTLDGVERLLDPSILVIADAERAVALAGIMGGLDTEVTASTTNILLEAANFDAACIRRGSRTLALRTEASLRFEKGLDPEQVPGALDRAAAILEEIAGGRTATGIVDVYPDPREPDRIDTRVSRVNGLLGTALAGEEMAQLLARLDFGVEILAEVDGTGPGNGGAGPSNGADRLLVSVPSFRRDVTLEADVAEEVARLHGYDRIESKLPSGLLTQGGLGRWLELEERIRSVLEGLGLQETLSYSFTAPDVYDRLEIPPDHPLRSFVTVANPLAEEQRAMRTTLLPGLMNVIMHNVDRRVNTGRIFEIARTYHLKQGEPPQRGIEAVSERRNVGVACFGDPNFFELKGLISNLLAGLGVEGVEFLPARAEFMHPGRCAEARTGGHKLAVLGELHPKVLRNYDLKVGVAAAEVYLDAVFPVAVQVRRYRPLPKFPPVVRDLALIVPREIPAAAVTSAIREAGGELVSEAALFDVYEGTQLPPGTKSLAFTITYQAPDRTLTEAEVREPQERILKMIGDRFGGRLRT